MPDNITLRAASYWRYAAPCFGEGASLDQAVASLATGIADQVRALLDSADAGWQPSSFIVCSTIVSSMITERASPQAALFRQQLQQALPLQAPYIVNAYECASWGYVLRHCASVPGASRVLLCIADLDVHQFDHWTKAAIWRNLWGHTGFGITTLCLDLAPGAQDSLQLTAGSGANSIMDFAKSLKTLAARHPEAAICQPFFPDKTQEMFTKLSGPMALLPGLHAEYGHCFGSDPWIALIERRLRAEQPVRAMSAIVGSLAFNGYSAVAQVHVPADAVVDLQDRPPLLSAAPSAQDTRIADPAESGIGLLAH